MAEAGVARVSRPHLHRMWIRFPTVVRAAHSKVGSGSRLPWHIRRGRLHARVRPWVARVIWAAGWCRVQHVRADNDRGCLAPTDNLGQRRELIWSPKAGATVRLQATRGAVRKQYVHVI